MLIYFYFIKLFTRFCQRISQIQTVICDVWTWAFEIIIWFKQNEQKFLPAEETTVGHSEITNLRKFLLVCFLNNKNNCLKSYLWFVGYSITSIIIMYPFVAVITVLVHRLFGTILFIPCLLVGCWWSVGHRDDSVCFTAPANEWKTFLDLHLLRGCW